MTIRFATPADAPALLDIYAQYIDTTVTFEYDLPTVEEFAGRIRDIAGFYPYLVCRLDGKAVGYAYAHRFRERAAYDWIVELSVYLDKDHTGRGLGTALYSLLIDLLRLQGVKTVMGCVTLPNEKSQALHDAMGFRRMGVSKNAGYKNGGWHDTGWFEKPIAPCDIPPAPVRPIGSVPQDEIAAVWAKYM